MWRNDSSVKLVVFGQVSVFLYCSIAITKSSYFVSGNSDSIILAIAFELLLFTKSSPFWIALVNFFINSLLLLINDVLAL